MTGLIFTLKHVCWKHEVCGVNKAAQWHVFLDPGAYNLLYLCMLALERNIPPVDGREPYMEPFDKHVFVKKHHLFTAA